MSRPLFGTSLPLPSLLAASCYYFFIAVLIPIRLVPTVFGQQFSATCYAPDGTPASDGSYMPCSFSGGASMCCPTNDTNSNGNNGDPRSGGGGSRDTCTEGGLCIGQSDGKTRRGYCTDQSWKSSACVSICTNSSVRFTSSPPLFIWSNVPPTNSPPSLITGGRILQRRRHPQLLPQRAERVLLRGRQHDLLRHVLRPHLGRLRHRDAVHGRLDGVRNVHPERERRRHPRAAQRCRARGPVDGREDRRGHRRRGRRPGHHRRGVGAGVPRKAAAAEAEAERQDGRGRGGGQSGEYQRYRRSGGGGRCRWRRGQEVLVHGRGSDVAHQGLGVGGTGPREDARRAGRGGRPVRGPRHGYHDWGQAGAWGHLRIGGGPRHGGVGGRE